LSEFSQDVDARDKPGHDEPCGKPMRGGLASAQSTDRQTEMAEYATAIPPANTVVQRGTPWTEMPDVL
jgi:hypothetical protein